MQVSQTFSTDSTSLPCPVSVCVCALTYSLLVKNKGWRQTALALANQQPQQDEDVFKHIALLDSKAAFLCFQIYHTVKYIRNHKITSGIFSASNQ